MSSFESSLTWFRTTESFTYETYDRNHEVVSGSGITMPFSSAPDYKGDASRLNPEEALVAALSSCHMLTFLAVAAKKGWIVERYEDHAVGTMDKNAEGRVAVTRTVLRPRIEFSGEVRPTPEQVMKAHEAAHRGCFIANSVKTEVVIEPAE